MPTPSELLAAAELVEEYYDSMASADGPPTKEVEAATRLLARHVKAGADETEITFEWLESIGFSDHGLCGFTKLLPPRSEGCAIAELCIEGDRREWFANIAQGVPDDPKVQDDIFSLTSLPTKLTRGHVVRLLEALGVEVGT